jgi:hypothetical protein
MLVAAVVVTVKVAAPGVALPMLIGVVEPKLNVGRSRAAVGVVATIDARSTLPENPLAGVIVIVELFPLVAPGETTTVEPAIAKLGSSGATTVTEVVPLLALYAASPV